MIKKMFNFEAENFCKVYLATHSIHSVFFPATAIVCPLTPATATLRNCNGFDACEKSIPCVVSEEEEEESESESESEDDDSDDANDEGADSTEVEDEEIHPEDYVQHLNPYFVVKTTKSSQRTNELYIPTGIAKDFGVSLEDGEKITFVDPYNRKSIGKVVEWKDQRTCIKGL
ncbi:hypothetical protein V6Z11_A09G109800 [Gossypium hirsutum]